MTKMTNERAQNLGMFGRALLEIHKRWKAGDSQLSLSGRGPYLTPTEAILSELRALHPERFKNLSEKTMTNGLTYLRQIQRQGRRTGFSWIDSLPDLPTFKYARGKRRPVGSKRNTRRQGRPTENKAVRDHEKGPAEFSLVSTRPLTEGQIKSLADLAAGWAETVRAKSVTISIKV